MQLTNVLRDVGEDIHRDRVYLPSEELEANALDPSEFIDGRVILNTSWEPYCHHYAKRARTYLEEARQLLPLLPRETRYSPAAMIAFYDKILKQIERSQGDVFTQRIRLNKAQKISLAAAVYLRHRFLPRFLDPVWGALATGASCPACDQSSGHAGLASSQAFHSATHGSMNGSTSKPDGRHDSDRRNHAVFSDTGSNQRQRTGPVALERALLEVEESVVHAHQAGPHLRPPPWAKPVPTADGGPSHHEGGFGASDVTEQADLHGQLVPCQVEEHEVPPVVDL